MRGEPSPPPAPPGAFDWRPLYGGIAASGDLGFNTGPVRVKHIGRSDRSFFSVWRKQPDGQWKVVLDLGVAVDLSQRDPFDDGFVAAPRPTRRRRPSPVIVAGAVRGATPAPHRRATRADLTSLDRQSGGTTANLMALLADDVRGLRWMVPPLVGRAAFAEHLAGRSGPIAFELLGSGMSAAGDLGYTYGRYERGAPRAETGYYARVWRLDRDAVWRIAFDVQRPDQNPAREAS
jgi:ketosteroid isomerase-like protein